MQSVWLRIADRDNLLAEAERTTPCETGGTLMGYEGEHDTIVITHIIGPGPKAVHMMIISGGKPWHITVHTPRTWWRTHRITLCIA